MPQSEAFLQRFPAFFPHISPPDLGRKGSTIWGDPDPGTVACPPDADTSSDRTCR